MMLALLRKGDKDKAVAEANALVAKSGNDPAVRNLVGGRATPPRARRMPVGQFNEALKLKPNDPRRSLTSRASTSRKARPRTPKPTSARSWRRTRRT